MALARSTALALTLASLLLISCVEETDTTFLPVEEPDLREQAQAALDASIEFLLSAQYPGGYWEGSFVTDTSFTADYILLMHYVGRVDFERQSKAALYILNEQQPDGGWNAYPGGPSVLYVSVLDYLALKLAGLDADDPALLRARDFILSQGGAEESNTLVKTRLALFGQVPWSDMLPLNTSLMAVEDLLYRFGYFHSVLIPMLVIYENHRVVTPRPGAGIREIFLTDPFAGDGGKRPRKGCCQSRAIDWILERQEKDGNWAGVFINTMYSMMALKSTGDPRYEEAIARGMAGVESFQNEDETTINQQFSQPPVMDTAYVLHVLLAAGINPRDEAVQRAVDWLLTKQTTIYGDWQVMNPEGEPGGWGFEHYNRYYPDVDCTVMALDAFALLDETTQQRVAESMRRGLQWTLTMQCDDGGWAAWDKNAIDPVTILTAYAGELWVPEDVSWSDITARAVLALANLNFGETDEDGVMDRALDFLKNKQEPWGPWWGRWGTNYTYATGQVLQALAAAGEDPSQPYIRLAADWLLSVQNPDGGWGEDPQSYLDPAWAGVGTSTIFQTAYALIGLMEVGETGAAIDGGIRHLVDTQRSDGSWYDEKFLGTNLPGYWYSRYDMLSNYKAAYALATYLNREKP